jgi:hypothetical protein
MFDLDDPLDPERVEEYATQARLWICVPPQKQASS